MFWTKPGTLHHRCEAVSTVDLNSADNTIYSGTVTDTHAACKELLTPRVGSEQEQGGFDAPAVSNEPTSESIRLFGAVFERPGSHSSRVFRIQRSVSSSRPRLEGGAGQILLAIDDRGDDPRCNEVGIQRRSESRR